MPYDGSKSETAGHSFQHLREPFRLRERAATLTCSRSAPTLRLRGPTTKSSSTSKWPRSANNTPDERPVYNSGKIALLDGAAATVAEARQPPCSRLTGEPPQDVLEDPCVTMLPMRCLAAQMLQFSRSCEAYTASKVTLRGPVLAAVSFPEDQENQPAGYFP
ncbi:T-complex protein 1 subunit gamma [Hypoxylon texense]